MLVAIAIGLFSGVTRTVGRIINARLAERIGALQSTCYTYLLGLVCSLLILVLDGQPAPFDPARIPAWAYLGGVIGVVFVVLSNYTTPRLSAFSMTVLMFAGQIGASILIDMALYQQLRPGRVAGGALVLAGLLGHLLIDQERRRTPLPATRATGPLR